MTKYTNNKWEYRQRSQDNDSIPISIDIAKYEGHDDDFKGKRIKYHCNTCYKLLVRLSDNGQEWYCNRCQLSYFPQDDKIRKKGKLETPDRNQEVNVAYVSDPLDDYLHSEKRPQLRGGIKALQEGLPTIRITEYSDSAQSGATIRSFADYYDDEDEDNKVTGKDGCPPKPGIIRSEKDSL